MKLSSIFKSVIFISLLFSTQAFASGSRVIVKGLGNKKAITSLGGQVVHKLKYHNGLVVNMSNQAVSQLKRKFPHVEVEIDQRVSLVAKPDKPGGGKGGNEEPAPVPPQVIPWGISRIGAIAAHDVNRGAGHQSLCRGYRGGC